jgi:hypothetical protein
MFCVADKAEQLKFMQWTCTLCLQFISLLVGCIFMRPLRCATVSKRHRVSIMMLDEELHMINVNLVA